MVIKKKISKTFAAKLTGVNGEEEEGRQFSFAEGEDQQSDDASLESQKQTLAVGTEGEVVAEAVDPAEGDGNQLQEDAHETDSFRTPTAHDLEDLRHFDQATPDYDAKTQGFRDSRLETDCIRKVEVDNQGFKACRGHETQVEYQITQFFYDIHPTTPLYLQQYNSSVCFHSITCVSNK